VRRTGKRAGPIVSWINAAPLGSNICFADSAVSAPDNLVMHLCTRYACSAAGYLR